MIETNPYRLEEAEWTPGNVYDIIPPGDLSHTGFEYSEGSDNIDEGEVRNSLVSGVADFFGKLLGGVGEILGGAIGAGVGVLGGIVQGVTGLIGGIASAIGSIFGGGNNGSIEPPEPIFNPIKTNLEGAIQPHLDDIEEAKGKIEAAQQEQESIKEDIVAQGKNLSTALSKADKGIADAKAAQESANQAISDVETKSGELSAEIEAQRKASLAREDALKKEINPKIEAAQSKGDNAMTEAEKAVGWLKNPSEIGTSVIAIDPETKRPYYANNLEVVEDNAPNSIEPVYMRPETSTGLTTHGPKVPVDPKIKYTVSFWAKADRPGSVIYGQMRGTNGSTMAPDGGPLFRGTITETNPPQPSNKGEDGKYVHSSAGNSYFISRLELPTEWTYYENEIQFSEGVTSVSIATMYWNHQYGVKANQYISGLDIRPQIPTQASVDEAQNEALRAHSEILRQQREINALNTAFQEEQKVINATKNELDTLQNEAIKANSKVGETNSTAIEALKAALDSVEQIVSLDNSYKAQQELINEQLSERQDILEEIQALQNQMISRSIVYDGKNDIYDDYLSVNGYYVVAKGTWVGAMVITTEKRSSSSDSWRTNFTQYNVPHLGSRTIRYYSGLSSNMDSARIDYWVYAGKSTKYAIEGAASYISGSSFTEGTWGLIKSFKMPENEGGSILNWESKLLNADRDVTYQVRLLVDGVQKKSYKVSGKGPMFPWESGVDYVKFIWDLNIPSGATVRIEGAATGSKANSTRAQTSYNRGTLTYVKLPEES